MATINLLPWREERRRERKRQFFIILGTAAGITLGIIVLVHGLFTQLIEHQQVRNKYIEDQIALLDKKITEIRELEKEKQRLLDRIRAIETLQTSRPVIVSPDARSGSVMENRQLAISEKDFVAQM
jgi:type IV pilus assembly protein PilN